MWSQRIPHDSLGENSAKNRAERRVCGTKHILAALTLSIVVLRLSDTWRVVSGWLSVTQKAIHGLHCVHICFLVQDVHPDPLHPNVEGGVPCDGL